MIFYVYLDPQVIPFAQHEGRYAMQSLIAILREFLQNCCIAEFQDLSVQSSIKAELAELPDDWDRTTLKKVFTLFSKRNLFVCCLTNDWMGEKTDLELVLEQARDSLLQMLLLKETPASAPDGVEVATLADYQHTDFAHERSRLAAYGVAVSDREMDENEFLDRHLKRALRYATRIEICDKLFGRKYKANYAHTARTLLIWLEQTLAAPADLTRLVFHCGIPDEDARSLEDMKREIAACKNGRLSDITIEIQLYAMERDDEAELPHQRFIITDQVAIGIDRGMDFLDRKTRRNRDVTLDYKSRNEIERILQSYEAARRELIVL